MTKDEDFKKQAEKALICLNGICEKREHCLRWQLREYVAKNRMTLTCINPRHKDVAKGKCPLYLDDKKIRMAKGMMQFYDEMPRKMEVLIKGQLLLHMDVPYIMSIATVNDSYRPRNRHLSVRCANNVGG